MVLASALGLIGLFLLVRLLFVGAAYALPLWAGAAVAVAAYRAGAGWLGTPIVGALAALALLALARRLFRARNAAVRAAAALGFAAPAAFAGYHLVHGLMELGGMAGIGPTLFSVGGALLVAGAALAGLHTHHQAAPGETPRGLAPLSRP